MKEGLPQKAEKVQGLKLKDHYQIKNVQNDLVIDVVRLGDEQNKAIIWQPDGGLTQTFCFEKAQNGFYIRCKKDVDLYLTIDNEKNGARLFVCPKSKDSSGLKKQTFRVQKRQDESFMILTFCNKVLEISHGGTDKGTHIVQAEKNHESYQYWRLSEPKPMPVENEEELLTEQKAFMQQPKKGEIGLNK